MGAPTPSSRQPKPSVTSGNCCFTSQRARLGSSRNSVASPNRAEARPAEPVISARPASKSGTRLNFATGGEGRGYTDADGNFIARRRPRADLPILRQTPLFPGDALVDALPTLTDVYQLADG